MTALEEEGGHEIIPAEDAANEDLKRALARMHIDSIAKDIKLLRMASLAAGGAIRALKNRA